MNRLTFLVAALACVATACGGGGDGGNGGPSAPPPPAPVASVSVVLGAGTLVPGGTTTASATLADASGRSLSGRAIAWTSSNPSVASIDASGLVTAVGVGAATVTATSEGRSGSATVNVVPPPVASVTVTVPSPTMEVGTRANASATTRDAAGNALTGRVVTWSSSAPSVATVDAQGVVTAVAPGSAAITALAEGKSGTATLTVVPPPVASVVVTGSTRVKVGDSYQYSATLRLTDGTIVNRPVSWTVRESARATMTASGSLTPTSTGLITIVAIVDGQQWDATTTAYDWESLSAAGSEFFILAADNQITNKFGRSEYADLVFVCSSAGYFFAWVSTQNFVTQNGLVAFSFDGGSPISQLWDESDDFDTLFKPGNNLTVKTFAQQVAASRLFGFAFTEFNASAKAMIFRVSGLAPRLATLFAKCPSNSLEAAERARVASANGARASRRVDDEFVRAERLLRAARPAAANDTPTLRAPVAPRSKQQARRR